MTKDNRSNIGWHRWFRRTNVYIAEYILMLIMMGALLGVLCSMLFSIFGLAYETGYAASTLAVVAGGQIAALAIIAPAALWLYSRTTGQEMIQPELGQHKARTVFLTLWMLGVVVTLISVAIATKLAAVSSVIGFDGSDSFGEAVVTAIIPGLLSVAVLAFGLWVVVKHATRKLSMITLAVFAGLTAVLLVATLAMAVVRKDVDETLYDNECTYSRYLDRSCSYSEYLRDSGRDMNRFDDDSRYLPGQGLYR